MAAFVALGTGQLLLTRLDRSSTQIQMRRSGGNHEARDSQMAVTWALVTMASASTVNSPHTSLLNLKGGEGACELYILIEADGNFYFLDI